MTEREPTTQEIAAFRRAARMLAKLGRAGCHLYLANDTLHLMAGQSHDDDHGQRPRHDRVRESVNIPGASGGDW